MMNPILVVVIVLVAIGVTAGAVWAYAGVFHKNNAKSKIGNAEERAREISQEPFDSAWLFPWLRNV